VPLETRDGPIKFSVVGEKANFSKDAEAFDRATCDTGRLDHIISSHQCRRTTLSRVHR